MEYYSVRSGLKITTKEDFYLRFSEMMEDFALRDYFKEKLHVILNRNASDVINRKSKAHIGINIFPFKNWALNQQETNLIFDSIEFLYRFVSKPGEWGYLRDHTNFNYEDYLSYNETEGKLEFIGEINIILKAYCQGYELKQSGEIWFVGDENVNFITVDFPEYNLQKVDEEIHLALKWWKNKDQTIEHKKQGIIKLAGVLEYLKTNPDFEKILSKSDTSDLFQIANKFGLRHNNLEQKIDFDKDIWFDWIFQYYLNTCICLLKLIKTAN